ncbi:M16 family metallopeptidase [Roseateles sp. LKC17W]|uniref:M16 family metallopeptidase n=1 Tax=Pelomonas margarita TaxID=3299031 RepID=A0ABW7FFU5_9BURK
MISFRIGLMLACLLAASVASTKPSRAAASKPVAPPAASVPAPAPATFVRQLGGIEEYRLPNGLQVLLFADATQTTTTVNITYRVGSRHEVAGEYGMAHLLEHLLFKGSARHPDIWAALAARGVGHNGTTTHDRTSYYASFNANANADTLAFLIDLEADRMVNSRVAKADLDTEMTVVRNEFERRENDPAAVLAQRVDAAAFAWHPYGQSVLGTPSDIENVPIEKLQAFYKRHYRPDNATLMIAGGFDKAATLALIARHFGATPKPATSIPQPYTVEPAQDGERSVVVRRVGGQPLLRVAYHVPAQTHPDMPALFVYRLLMNRGLGERLDRELADAGLAAVSATLNISGGVDPGLVSLNAALPPDVDMDKVQAVLTDLLEGRSAKPFEERDLQRVRDSLATGLRQQIKNPEALIELLHDFIGAGDWRLWFKQMQDAAKVTLADVERVRAAYFKPANRTLGRYLPSAAVERVEIPAAPPLEPYLAELQPPPQVEEGELLDSAPAVLESRTERTTLPSGIALHTLRKQTRGNTVALQMQLRWGEHDLARSAARMVAPLMVRGSEGYSLQQLRDALTKLGASAGIWGDEQGATIKVSAERDALLPALRLMADVLRRPSLSQASFDGQVASDINAADASRQALDTLREGARRAHVNAARGVKLGDPGYLMSVDERIARLKSVTLDEVKRFYADYWSANEAQVSVAGALPDGLADEVERLFGDWKKPAATKYVRHIPQHIAVPAARFDAVARDKASASVKLEQALPLNAEDPDYLPLVMAVRIFGVGMESRLSERVRQKDGLTYDIGASLDVSDWGNAGSFGIEASYAPQNRDRIIAAVQEEIRRMSAEGVTTAELARNKKSFLEGRKPTRLAPDQLAGYLAALAEKGETWNLFQRQDDAIAAVTVEQVNAAWRKHIKAENFIISTAGDFNTP